MAVQNLKYCEYFDVNEKYFPCIDESAINSGASLDDTYPHTTFIDLLNLTEKMLGGNTNRSIWIHGAYGTGKSKCAYTLKKILEVPEEEVISRNDCRRVPERFARPAATEPADPENVPFSQSCTISTMPKDR